MNKEKTTGRVKIDEEHYALCLNIAILSHEGQSRKFSGLPYIIHPIAVATSFHRDEHLEKCVAILHDVVEDTEETYNSLREKGVHINIIEVLKYLTHEKHLSYKDYILRMKNSPYKAGKIACRVKIADIKHNMSDLGKGGMRDKYELALHILEN